MVTPESPNTTENGCLLICFHKKGGNLTLTHIQNDRWAEANYFFICHTREHMCTILASRVCLLLIHIYFNGFWLSLPSCVNPAQFSWLRQRKPNEIQWSHIYFAAVSYNKLIYEYEYSVFGTRKFFGFCLSSNWYLWTTPGWAFVACM